MDLSTTEEAGAIYESYLENFTNADDTVNWLPMCGEVDGLVAPCNSFTASVFKADYTEKMVGNMIMLNPLCAWQTEMTGAQLKELADDDSFKVTSLDIPASFDTLTGDMNHVFEMEEDRVKVAWTEYMKDGGTLAESEKYITLK